MVLAARPSFVIPVDEVARRNTIVDNARDGAEDSRTVNVTHLIVDGEGRSRSPALHPYRFVTHLLALAARGGLLAARLRARLARRLRGCRLAAAGSLLRRCGLAGGLLAARRLRAGRSGLLRLPVRANDAVVLSGVLHEIELDAADMPTEEGLRGRLAPLLSVLRLSVHRLRLVSERVVHLLDVPLVLADRLKDDFAVAATG